MWNLSWIHHLSQHPLSSPQCCSTGKLGFRREINIRLGISARKGSNTKARIITRRWRKRGREWGFLTSDFCLLPSTGRSGVSACASPSFCPAAVVLENRGWRLKWRAELFFFILGNWRAEHRECVAHSSCQVGPSKPGPVYQLKRPYIYWL